MNQVLLIGRLVQTPELSVLQSGNQYTRFTLAVSRRYKNDKGKYPTDFIPCVLWGKRAEKFVQYLCKGTLVSVLGELRFSRVDRGGKTSYYSDVHCTDFQFIEPKSVVEKRMERLEEKVAKPIEVVPVAQQPIEVVQDELPF